MERFQELQQQVLSPLADDPRLTSSAKSQIAVFQRILRQEANVGFDTTSALLYGFLSNEAFTDPETCPLSPRQIAQATQIARHKATRDTAHETTLLARVSRLPLTSVLGPCIDLKDLAISFLTYASDEPYFAFSFERNRKLYEYLDISRQYYLNVYNLRYDLDKIGMSIEDFIVNLSRIRNKLFIPDSKLVTVQFRSILERVGPRLPDSLFELSGESLEDLAMEIFDGAGYRVVRVGRHTFEADGGVDVIAYSKQPLAGDFRLAIQCKATKNKIHPRAIREFNTSLQNFKSHKGVFITTSEFTSGVDSEVEKRAYPIELMDYVKLMNKIRGAVLKC